MLRFSILVPTFNQSKYLRQAIDSILSQSFTRYEVIVIDDGSIDDTPRVLESYGSRIHVIRQSNQGPEIARNNAAALATGEYLAMLDHDDLFLPRAFEIYDRVIRSFDSPPLVIGAMGHFQGDGPIPAKLFVQDSIQVLKYRDFLAKDIPIASSNSRIIMRKDVFEKIGGYRSLLSAGFYSDDFNLILKAGTFSPCVVVRKPYTVAKREHAENSSGNLKATANAMLHVVDSERARVYPGGKQRRQDRYACIGGLTSAYAVRYCWRRKERRVALRLLLGSAPMVMGALRRKLLRGFGHPIQPIILPVEPPELPPKAWDVAS